MLICETPENVKTGVKGTISGAKGLLGYFNLNLLSLYIIAFNAGVLKNGVQSAGRFLKNTRWKISNIRRKRKTNTTDMILPSPEEEKDISSIGSPIDEVNRQKNKIVEDDKEEGISRT